MTENAPRLRWLGRVPYAETYAAMRRFTEARTPEAADELWLLQHPPVFTQGQAGRAEHLHDAGGIPVVQSNRGGQITYHGPGQAVVYVLVNLHRAGYGIRSLVTRIEQAMIDTLSGYAIEAHARADAPGVYVTRTQWPDHPDASPTRKIGSLGLRVSRGCSYHGLSLNVAMDLSPFLRIDPCGLSGMQMTQVANLGGPVDVDSVLADLARHLSTTLAPRPELMADAR